MRRTKLYFCTFFCSFFAILISFGNTNQSFFQINKESDFEQKSIHSCAKIINLKQNQLSIQEIIKLSDDKFETLLGPNLDLGFTDNNYWVKFELKNNINQISTYFFETARPITDIIELYAVDANGKISKQVSGDAIPFSDKTVGHRKSIFKINLNPQENIRYYLHVKSDGEVLTMPLLLHSMEGFLKIISFEQIVFGFFYGILAIASILYFFFFFAMKEKVFLYYSLYIVFIGLLQFSVDGYFYEFITPNAGWFSQRSVLIFATIANVFLGRYTQTFLKIRNYNKTIDNFFWALYILDFICFCMIVFTPSLFKYCYSLANLLGLVLLVLILTSLVVIYYKTKKIPVFFAVGILSLVAGFIVFILKNFSILPLSFLTENSSKLGTGLEIVFLSLSMANLVRNLKDEREALQSLALTKSEEMNELKSHFLSNISHELRTPLNTIINLSDLIITENKDEALAENCNGLKNSTQNLLSSVNDILDFSKIEKNELKLEEKPFNLIEVIDQVVTFQKGKAIEKGLKFSISNTEDVPMFVFGDSTRLAQILNNLLSNAIKFTAVGEIRFSIYSKQVSSGKIILSFDVVDTGTGIKKEKIDSIFDSFSQENISDKRKFDGLGLGLYIVKKLVSLQQGKIEVKSTLGLGTDIRIELPFVIVKTEESVALTQDVIEKFDLGGKKVLVVEDNLMNQMVIKMITKKWQNASFEYAINGEVGLQLLQKNKFDIVLMDLQMPVMDGYEATTAIRNGNAGIDNKKIPIIAVTADVMETTKERVISIGMNKYMSKPFDGVGLFKNIIECCSLKREILKI